MRKSRRKTPVYDTDDIIIGYGEVKAVRTDKGIQWVLPGNVYTSCRDRAVQAAEKLDRMVQVNLQRYDRKLVW